MEGCTWLCVQGGFYKCWASFYPFGFPLNQNEQGALKKDTHRVGQLCVCVCVWLSVMLLGFLGKESDTEPVTTVVCSCSRDGCLFIWSVCARFPSHARYYLCHRATTMSYLHPPLENIAFSYTKLAPVLHKDTNKCASFLEGTFSQVGFEGHPKETHHLGPPPPPCSPVLSACVRGLPRAAEVAQRRFPFFFFLK